MPDPDEYREDTLRRYGERCIVCGSTEQVKVHHQDGDHDNDRRDNRVPLCQGCHVDLHRGAPPYTIWFTLGQPAIRALDELREKRGYADRSETVAKLLEEAGDELSDETEILLTQHNRFRSTRRAMSDGGSP